LSSSNRRVRSSKSTSSPPPLLAPGTLSVGRMLLGTEGRSGKFGGAGGAEGGTEGPDGTSGSTKKTETKYYMEKNFTSIKDCTVPSCLESWITLS